MYQLVEFSVYAHELGILELDVHQIPDFAKLFLVYNLGNSVFNVHQVPKVLIHVHQH
jgi:hypothetical protein